MDMINLREAPLVDKPEDGATLFALNVDGTVNRIKADGVGGGSSPSPFLVVPVPGDTSLKDETIVIENFPLTYDEMKDAVESHKILSIIMVISKSNQVVPSPSGNLPGLLLSIENGQIVSGYSRIYLSGGFVSVIHFFYAEGGQPSVVYKMEPPAS